MSSNPLQHHSLCSSSSEHSQYYLPMQMTSRPSLDPYTSVVHDMKTHLEHENSALRKLVQARESELAIARQ